MNSYTTPDGKTFTTKEEYKKYIMEKHNVTKEDMDKAEAIKQANKEKYTQGVWIENIETKYGEIFKVTLDISKLQENASYNKGKIVFSIQKSKKGTYYAKNMTY